MKGLYDRWPVGDIGLTGCLLDSGLCGDIGMPRKGEGLAKGDGVPKGDAFANVGTGKGDILGMVSLAMGGGTAGPVSSGFNTVLPLLILAGREGLLSRRRLGGATVYCLYGPSSSVPDDTGRWVG